MAVLRVHEADVGKTVTRIVVKWAGATEVTKREVFIGLKERGSGDTN